MKTRYLTKLDLRARFAYLYNTSPGAVDVVTVPELNFLMVDGVGSPESGPFQQAIQTLYGLSYTVKFATRKEKGIDYPVMALEGLWWTGSSEESFDPVAVDRWKWTLMIMQPETVNGADFEAAAKRLTMKGTQPATFRLARMKEGLAVQTLHVGPYSEELPTIDRLQAFMHKEGYFPNGKHHEIYLGDPRRTAPTRLRTLLRQPVRKAKP